MDLVCDHPKNTVFTILSTAQIIVSLAGLILFITEGIVSGYITNRICKRKQVPSFVNSQLILINFHWVSKLIYYTVMLLPIGNTRFLENFLTILSIMCLLSHDWIFTEKFLRVTLLMKKKLDLSNSGSKSTHLNVTNDRELQQAYTTNKNLVETISKKSNFAFYACLFGWAIYVLISFKAR